jgi:glycine/D-amino acid oxidase-like deaminating enzyme
MKVAQNEKANVVIVGGGVFGNSIAYHYAKNNSDKKVIVLERNELCNAATSRAAAMITKYERNENLFHWRNKPTLPLRRWKRC